MTDSPDLEGTLDTLRSMRNSIRDLTRQAREQNQSLRSDSDAGFFRTVPAEFNDEIDRQQSFTDACSKRLLAGSFTKPMPVVFTPQPEG